jgi:hypothetical protein
MPQQFTWVPLYRELADRLLEWETRQGDLIEFLENLRADGLVVSPLMDQDPPGTKFLIEEIAPFTFFAPPGFEWVTPPDPRPCKLLSSPSALGLMPSIPTRDRRAGGGGMAAWHPGDLMARGLFLPAVTHEPHVGTCTAQWVYGDFLIRLLCRQAFA